ncbi:hypothetical protein HNP73_004552 [Amaricoccus macauensis]|uniref:Uncharacterized protein n=1 Tax=Amaricoccus macauensis TaxID=57001 RepID=A0A840SZR8_9RHOB|nr:hypothetical protein [Amaricoccus macauensis]MBB5224581.1 hypothetical protein [Amaricoccus macauensis]
MRMKRIAAAAAVLVIASGGAQAAGGSFTCKDGFGTMKEIKAEVGGSSAFISIVNQYVQRWDAREAQRLCSAYAAGGPATISCLNGKRDWNAIKASIPPAYFGGSNQQLADAYTAEVEKGTGYLEAMTYCRSVGAIK